MDTTLPRQARFDSKITDEKLFLFIDFTQKTKDEFTYKTVQFYNNIDYEFNFCDSMLLKKW